MTSEQTTWQTTWHLAAIRCGLYRGDTDVSTADKWESAQAKAACDLLAERDKLKIELEKSEAKFEKLAGTSIGDVLITQTALQNLVDLLSRCPLLNEVQERLLPSYNEWVGEAKALLPK